MSRVKVAIVGAGWVTENCYLPHLGPDGPLEAAAVYDPDAERAGRVAASLGLPRPGRDVAECLDSSIRGVIICTPTHTHLPLALRALEAGKYVLCEKPVARDEEEADALRATPAAASRLMGSATTRLRSDVELLMSWVRSGRVGEVRRIALGWWRGRGVPASGPWHTDPRACPAGVLEDLGPHLLDIAAALLPAASPENVESTLECRYGAAGRVAEWHGAGDAAARAYDTPDYAHASVDFVGGPSLELEVCWASEERGDLSEIVFEGTQGTASLRGLFGFSTSRREPRQVCTLSARGRADEVVEFTPGPQGQREAFGRSVETFAQFCAGEGPPVADLQEVLKVASLLAAVRRHASLSPAAEALV
ncbi:MAG: Gfo/Idh/MocA family oxidoreductase [Pyrinomonadaceae bacterium]